MKESKKEPKIIDPKGKSQQGLTVSTRVEQSSHKAKQTDAAANASQ